MAYRDFKLTDIQQKFGIDTIFANIWEKETILEIEPSDFLKQSLKFADLIPLTTEKALSERLLAPILAEVKSRNADKIQIFSGETISADKSLGLNGEIDFLMVKKPYAPEPIAPIIAITEAKVGRLDKAIPQAAAQMIGARVFNQNYGEKIDLIYGVVTDGNSWRFLMLKENQVLVDNTRYSLTEINKILGIFQYIIDSYRVD